MIDRIGKFEKVSFEQFKSAIREHFLDATMVDDTVIEKIYNNVAIPNRATSGSAGYDFVSYFNASIAPGQTVTIPTGIKAYMEPGWFLGLYPRSGLGFKYRLQLDNTVGIIDSDYYNNPKTEGHIIVKITNCSNISNNILHIRPSDKFVQGIFQPYGITYGDTADEARIGGFGSTDAKQ